MKRQFAIALALLVWRALPALANPLAPGTAAPPFTRPGFDDKPVSLPKGKAVLLDFWASWCAPCIVELPHLIALRKRYAGRLEIIGVAMDDDAKAPRQTVAQYRVSYPVVMGDLALARLYGGVLGLPEVFLIGRDGKVIKSWRGDFRPGELDTAIAAALR
ncbi:MAG TPA: TlpA disulfide reductase family protein [Rhizomicrobium sp.]|nr:TlpA disulfide reductase family protein [Rhizomicrobium sp.]